MINKLGLPLFVIGVFLILISFSRIPQANIESTRSIQASSSPVATPSISISSLVTITKVVDGDTVDVNINGKKDTIRLIGINAPESGECFGRESTGKARELLQGKSVTLETDSSQDNRDKYQRLLRYIFLSDGSNFGELMIKDGFAKEYTFITAYKYQFLYKQAQQQAKNNKKGLWTDNACSKSGSKVKAESTFSPQASSNNQSFSCDCSKLCSQIQTCDEAYFQLNNCGCTKRDSDRDSIPCESLCK